MAATSQPKTMVVRLPDVAPAVLFLWSGGIVLLNHAGVKLLSNVLLGGKAGRDMIRGQAWREFTKRTMAELKAQTAKERDDMWERIGQEMFETVPVPGPSEQVVKSFIIGADCASVEMGATSQNAYDPFASQEATPEELVEWFVAHGWLQSKQELVNKLLKAYKVMKR